MGVSTDGILCYGFFLLGDEEFGEEEYRAPRWLLDGDGEDAEEMCFDDFLAKIYGIPHPGEWKEHCEQTKKKFSEYWEKKEKLEKEVGIEIVFHCSDDYTMRILAVKESVHTARRGEPVELKQTISAKPEWREKLKSFCEKAGIEFQEPQFILCSWYG